MEFGQTGLLWAGQKKQFEAFDVLFFSQENPLTRLESRPLLPDFTDTLHLQSLQRRRQRHPDLEQLRDRYLRHLWQIPGDTCQIVHLQSFR